MGNENVISNKKNSVLKITVAVVATMLLGAIGNGVWEWFLRDLFIRCGNLMLYMFSITFDNYVDILHESIGEGDVNYFAIPPFVLSTSLLIGLAWAPFLMMRAMYKRWQIKTVHEEAQTDKRRQKLLNWITQHRRLVLVIWIVYGVLGTLSFSQATYAIYYRVGAVLFIERSIDIMAPHIGPTKTIELQAQYRAIDDAASFYELESELHQISSQYGVRIPEFISIKKIVPSEGAEDVGE